MATPGATPQEQALLDKLAAMAATERPGTIIGANLIMQFLVGHIGVRNKSLANETGVDETRVTNAATQAQLDALAASLDARLDVLEASVADLAARVATLEG